MLPPGLDQQDGKGRGAELLCPPVLLSQGLGCPCRRLWCPFFWATQVTLQTCSCGSPQMFCPKTDI